MLLYEINARTNLNQEFDDIVVLFGVIATGEKSERCRRLLRHNLLTANAEMSPCLYESLIRHFT